MGSMARLFRVRYVCTLYDGSCQRDFWPPPAVNGGCSLGGCSIIEPRNTRSTRMGDLPVRRPGIGRFLAGIVYAAAAGAFSASQVCGGRRCSVACNRKSALPRSHGHLACLANIGPVPFFSPCRWGLVTVDAVSRRAWAASCARALQSRKVESSP